MADFIIHHEGAYNIFGTIADGVHYETALTIDQLRKVIRLKHGEAGVANLQQRLERAHLTGCSGFGWSLDDCIRANRWDGNRETEPGPISRDEFIRRHMTLATAIGRAGKESAA